MGVRFTRDDGSEIDIPEDRITRAWTEDGEEVEGHVFSAKREDEDDTEGHLYRYKREDGSELDLSKVTKIAFTDDEGNEQEVEGHLFKVRV